MCFSITISFYVCLLSVVVPSSYPGSEASKFPSKLSSESDIQKSNIKVRSKFRFKRDVQ